MSDPQKPGVAHTLGPLPPVPPGPIASMLKAQVHAALAEIPEGKQGAVVAVADEDGVNLVFAHRTGDRFTATVWVGKSWGEPLRGGVQVKASW